MKSAPFGNRKSDLGLTNPATLQANWAGCSLTYVGTWIEIYSVRPNQSVNSD
jgi:hypothetical protein